MYEEEDFLPISALQHLAYCPRRCALIYLEQVWDENRFTTEGKHLHEDLHEGGAESRGDLRIVRGLRLHSFRLGLSGQADVVEFHRVDQPPGVALPEAAGLWRPFPVEYKRGKPKIEDCDRVQVCAQALCLEEMLQLPVSEGALYYGRPRRREQVTFADALRRETEALAARLHEMVAVGVTPPAQVKRACRDCSLVDLCLPRVGERKRSARRYLAAALRDLRGGGEVAQSEETA